MSTTLTATESEQFTKVAAHFTNPENALLSLNFPDAPAALAFRVKVQQYADAHQLTAGFPAHADCQDTGEDDGIPGSWNTGANVTFRYDAA